MAVPEYRQGDTWPPITGTVLDGNGSPVDIHTALSIRFVSLPAGASPGTGSITGTTVNLDDGTLPNRGRWSYTWATHDLDVIGTYEVMIEVTWSAGKIESFPSSKLRAGTYLVTADND
jgi:hypothetical protein